MANKLLTWAKMRAFIANLDGAEDGFAAERERWKAALAYAIQEADGWHDEARGGPIGGDERMEAARALLKGG